MKKLFLFMLLSAATLHAQNEGIWEGYDGEWAHVSRQLIALAEATPAEKFSWRPAPGVRSTSEVYMHLGIANFYLLSVTGASGWSSHSRPYSNENSSPFPLRWQCRFPINTGAPNRSRST
jgi:hypothetical protein